MGEEMQQATGNRFGLCSFTGFSEEARGLPPDASVVCLPPSHANLCVTYKHYKFSSVVVKWLFVALETGLVLQQLFETVRRLTWPLASSVWLEVLMRGKKRTIAWHTEEKTGPESDDALKYWLRFRATHGQETTLTREIWPRMEGILNSDCTSLVTLEQNISWKQSKNTGNIEVSIYKRHHNFCCSHELSRSQIRGDEIDRTLKLHGENHKYYLRTSGPKLEGKNADDYWM